LTVQICEKTDAELIQSIGQMLVLFRRNPDKARIALPSA
jgi:RNA-binding protein YhbY